MNILSIVYYPIGLLEKLLNTILPSSFHQYAPFAALLMGIVIVTVLIFFVISRLNKRRSSEEH